MKKQIIDLVKKMAGHNYLYLDSVLQVKKSPHSPSASIWAIAISPDDNIWLMDANEQWFELEDSDINYSLVLSTLFQRVQTIYKNYQVS